MDYDEGKVGKLMFNKRINDLRKNSGDVASSDPFVSFLYTLMRDHVTPGVVEQIALDMASGSKVVTYTNGFLARYAENISNFIKNSEIDLFSGALGDAFADGNSPAFLDAKKKDWQKKVKKESMSKFSMDEVELKNLDKDIQASLEKPSEEEIEQAEKVWEKDAEKIAEYFEEKGFTTLETKPIILGEEAVTSSGTVSVDNVVAETWETKPEDTDDTNALTSSFLALDQLKDMVPEVSELVDIVKNEALAQFEETTLTEESEGEELEEPESPEQLKIRRNLHSIAAEASRRGLIDKDKESIDLYVQRLSFLSKEDLGVAKAFVFATVLPSLTREEILAEKAKLIEGKLAKTDVKREEAIDFIETEVELLNVTAKVELSKEAESVMKLKTNMRKGRGTLSEASEINVLAEKLKDVVKTSATLPGDKPLGSFSRGG